MNEIISVIVPVYNIEENISFCIKSILQQTYCNYELILVDDGSTDRSGTICDEFAAQNSKIKVIHQQNSGLSRARNVGIEASIGSKIMFVDGDDILLDKRMLEILIHDYTMQPEAVYSSCGYQRIHNYKNIPVEISVMENYSTDEIIEKLLNGSYQNISACGKLYNKEYMGSIRFAEGKIYFEDKAFLFYLLLNNPGKIITERKDKIYGYYIRNNSITRSKYNAHVPDVLYHSEGMLRTIREKRPNLLSLGEKNDVVSHLLVMKSIVRSHVYLKEKVFFNHIKKQLFSKYEHLDKKLLANYWWELKMLKTGNYAYIICVYIFDAYKRIINKGNQ